MTNLDTFNPDVLEVGALRYANTAVIVLPLKSGNFALMDRSFGLRAIIEAENLDRLPDAVRFWSQTANIELSTRARLAETFGEPDDRTLGRDIKNNHRAPRTPRPAKAAPVVVEIDIDI